MFCSWSTRVVSLRETAFLIFSKVNYLKGNNSDLSLRNLSQQASVYLTCTKTQRWRFGRGRRRGLVFCAVLFSFISYTSLKVSGLCKVVCEWLNMKSVTIVKVLVVVFAFSRTFVSGVFLSPGVEHGGQGGQGTGTQRYDREFLISLQTPQVPSDFPFELFPAEMTNRVNVRKRRKRGKSEEKNETKQDQTVPS